MDDNVDSDNIEENKECDKVVKIDTIGDGSCFIHSVLKCVHTEYKEKTIIKDRKELAHECRKSLIEILKEPNPSFPTLESVIEFVKDHFFGNKKGLSKEAKGIKTITFFQVCYGFEYIPYPFQIKEYTNDFFSSGKEYYDYILNYRSYLLEFESYLDRKVKILPKMESLTPKQTKIEIKPLTKEMIEYVDNMKKVQENISKKVSETTYDLRKILKQRLGNNIYNPQNFGAPYVQAFLRGIPLPKGMYADLPFNCYFFTANPGVLDRFAYYPERLIPRLEDIDLILDNTRVHLGDMDIIPFIPGVFNLNILIINFEENQLINEYSHKLIQSEPWIVIAHVNNNHYDPCGFKVPEGIQTIFAANDPFILTILKSKETKGKIDWALLDKKEELVVEIIPKDSLPSNVGPDYKSMTTEQLKKIAIEKGIRILTSYRKPQIIEILKNS